MAYYTQWYYPNIDHFIIDLTFVFDFATTFELDFRSLYINIVDIDIG